MVDRDLAAMARIRIAAELASICRAHAGTSTRAPRDRVGSAHADGAAPEGSRHATDLSREARWRCCHNTANGPQPRAGGSAHPRTVFRAAPSDADGSIAQ